MALDLGAIDAAKQELDSKSSGNLIKVSDLKDKGEYDIRLLPPPPSLKGLFYLKTVDLKLGEDGGWCKSLLTFGDPDCPVMKIWADAKKDTDEAVKARAMAISEKPSYFMPIMLLELDTKGNVKEAVANVLTGKQTIVSNLSGFFTDARYNNGTDDLLCDRKEGRNFTIKRTGTTQFNTKYTLQPWPSNSSFEDEKYDEIYNNIPDPVEIYRAMMGDISTQVDMITNYLYGKPGGTKKQKEATDD